MLREKFEERYEATTYRDSTTVNVGDIFIGAEVSTDIAVTVDKKLDDGDAVKTLLDTRACFVVLWVCGNRVMGMLTAPEVNSEKARLIYDTQYRLGIITPKTRRTLVVELKEIYTNKDELLKKYPLQMAMRITKEQAEKLIRCENAVYNLINDHSESPEVPKAVVDADSNVSEATNGVEHTDKDLEELFESMINPRRAAQEAVKTGTIPVGDTSPIVDAPVEDRATFDNTGATKAKAGKRKAGKKKKSKKNSGNEVTFIPVEYTVNLDEFKKIESVDIKNGAIYEEAVTWRKKLCDTPIEVRLAGSEEKPRWMSYITLKLQEKINELAARVLNATNENSLNDGYPDVRIRVAKDRREFEEHCKKVDNYKKLKMEGKKKHSVAILLVKKHNDNTGVRCSHLMYMYFGKDATTADMLEAMPGATTYNDISNYIKAMGFTDVKKCTAIWAGVWKAMKDNDGKLLISERSTVGRNTKPRNTEQQSLSDSETVKSKPSIFQFRVDLAVKPKSTDDNTADNTESSKADGDNDDKADDKMNGGSNNDVNK